MKTLLLILGLAGVTILFVWIAGRALDANIDNQNTMLCESALKSGNEEWLEKCQPYYSTGRIEYLRYE